MSSAAKLITAVAVASLLFHGLAVAGPLPADPNAMAGFKGSQNFTLFPTGLTSRVEYAVYAPGSYAASVALGNPADPSIGTRYVYTYEVFNTSPASMDDDDAITRVSVGINGDQQVQNISWLAGFGQIPGLAYAVPASGPVTSARWDDNNGIYSGVHSTILLYTSPFKPTFSSASLLGFGTFNQQTLPSPVPEPATCVLISLGFISVVGSRLIRRFRSNRG